MSRFKDYIFAISLWCPLNAKQHVDLVVLLPKLFQFFSISISLNFWIIVITIKWAVTNGSLKKGSWGLQGFSVKRTFVCKMDICFI